LEKRKNSRQAFLPFMYIPIDCLPNQQYVPDSAYLQEGSPSFT
jgi:hypothetical protein